MTDISSTKKRKLRQKLWSNVKFWSDYERLHSGYSAISRMFQTLFIPKKAQKIQSLEEVMHQYRLNAHDIVKKQQAFWRLTMIMLIVSSLIFCYAIYHLMHHRYHVALLTGSILLIPLALAFRYHFWYYQLKSQRLGCTFTQWLNYITGRHP